jgi:ATP-dependent protease HslVU (ClpYQ) peptidase subunit
MTHSQLGAKEIVEQSLAIAGDLCIYTNRSIDVEVIE